MRHKGRSENCVTSGRNLNKIGPRSSPTVRSISIGDRYTPISAGIFRLAGGKLNYQVKSTVWDYSGILSCPWYCVNSIIDLPGEMSPNILFRFFNFQKSTKNALLVVGRQWHRKMIMKSKDPVPVGWRALDSSWQHCSRTVDGVGAVVKHYTHDLLRDNNIDHFYFRHRPVHTWLWCVLCLNIKNISTRHPEVSVQRHGCIRYAI